MALNRTDLINRARQAFDALPELKFDFVYYVYKDTLVGGIAGESFVLHAVSGGGRGRTRGVPDTSPETYDPRRPATKTQRGGVLPPGIWQIEKPSLYHGSKRPPISRLIPVGGQRLEYQSRDFDHESFMIQGPDPKGSDGGIVIERIYRRKFLAAVERAGGAFLLVSVDFDPPVEAAPVPSGGRRRVATSFRPRAPPRPFRSGAGASPASWRRRSHSVCWRLWL